MNKLIVNQLEKLFVTNDAATIIRELDVVHPAAKLLVMASQQQEQEVGFILTTRMATKPILFLSLLVNC